MILSNLICLVPPEVVHVNLSGLCSPGQVDHLLYDGDTHTLNFVIPSNRVIMTVMMSKQGLQFNMGFKPWGEAWYFSHSHDYICGRTECFNLRAEKFTHTHTHTHTNVTWDQTWCCLHDNPVLMSDHHQLYSKIWSFSSA
jgi:hypothetical protein